MSTLFSSRNSEAFLQMAEKVSDKQILPDKALSLLNSSSNTLSLPQTEQTYHFIIFNGRVRQKASLPQFTTPTNATEPSSRQEYFLLRSTRAPISKVRSSRNSKPGSPSQKLVSQSFSSPHVLSVEFVASRNCRV